MMDRYRGLSPNGRRGVMAVPVFIVFILVAFVVHASGGGQLSVTGTNPGTFSVATTTCQIVTNNAGAVDLRGTYNGQTTEIIVHLAASNRYPGVVNADDPSIAANNFANQVQIIEGDAAHGAPRLRLSGTVTVNSDTKSGSVNLNGPGLQITGNWTCNA